MKYSFLNNDLVVKFNDYNQYLLYSKILSDNFNITKNNFKKKINIDLSSIIILNSIDDYSLLVNVLNSFNNLLKINNIFVEKFNQKNILVLLNNNNKNYTILGLTLSIEKSNIYSIISRDLNISISDNISDLSYLVFTNKIHNSNLDTINNLVFSNKISIIATNEDILNNSSFKNLPIAIMKTYYSRYLSNVLRFIKINKNEIKKVKYIVVSKDIFDSSLFSKELFSQFKNYLIIGNKTQKTIMNPKFTKIIKTLFKNNDTGMKDIDLNMIYSDYTHLIFRTKYILNIIDIIQEFDIEQVSLYLSYYDKI